MTAGCLFFWLKDGDELTEDDRFTSEMQRNAQKAEMEKMALRVAASQGFRTPEPSYGDELTEDDRFTSEMQRNAQKAEMEKMALRVAASQGFRTPEPSYGAMGWVQPTALPQSQPFL